MIYKLIDFSNEDLKFVEIMKSQKLSVLFFPELKKLSKIKEIKNHSKFL